MVSVEGAGKPALSSIDVALAWANAGFRCFPVHQKRPVVNNWNTVATSNIKELRSLFTNPNWDCALIPGSAGYVVFDCDIKEGKLGPQLASDLGIPDSFVIHTPSGGEHRWCRKLEDKLISNYSPWAREGIDVRSDTGYVLAAGSSGYDIHIGSLVDAEYPPSDIWDMLHSPVQGILELPQKLSQATKEMVEYLSREFPGMEIFLDKQNRGVVNLLRPGKARGISATVGVLDTKGRQYQGALWNFSSSWDVRYGEGPYCETFLLLRCGKLVTMEEAHEADIDSFVRESVIKDAQPEHSTWYQTDHIKADLLSHLSAPEPTLLRRIDGPALLYDHKLNVIFGKAGGGKTWLAMETMRQCVLTGGRAVFADFEDSAHTFASRFRDIGFDLDEYVKEEMLQYWSPSDELRPSDLDGVNLLVIDSATHFLGMFGSIDGGSSNSNDHVARVYSRLTRLAEGTGTSIILIDHGSKGDDKATIGASSKRNVVNGTEVRVVNQQPFAKGLDGWSAIFITKDRNGGIQGGDPTLVRNVDGGIPWAALTFTMTFNEVTGSFGTKLEIVEPRPQQRQDRITKGQEVEMQIIATLLTAPGNRMKSESVRVHAELSKQTYSDALLRLLEKGIVRKEDDSTDGRVVWIILIDPE